MKHKIKLPDGTAQLIKITSAYFKSWHVWNIQFDNGKAVTLFKMGGEWMQRREDFLDEHVLLVIGKCIDKIIMNRNTIAY